MVTTKEIKEALRHPYTFPGGYTLAFFTYAGDQLCPACIRANWREVIARTKYGDPPAAERIEYITVRWEGPPNECGQCGKELPSEYGDPDEEDSDNDD